MNVLIVILALAALAAAGLLVNRWRAAHWARQPQPPGRLVESGAGPLYMMIQGEGLVTVILENRLGGLSAEWRLIQAQLAQRTRVVSYDRPGSGWSGPVRTPRTSAQIAAELHTALVNAGVPGPYLLVGHSQGGLYLQHFARLYPQDVVGAVFLDPATHLDEAFRRELPPEVYRGSGVDKTGGARQLGILSRLGLLPLLRPLFIQSPPFYYYRSFPPALTELIWRHHLRADFAAAALAEYAAAQSAENTRALLAQPFPPIPLRVIYHTPQVIIDEIVKYGGLTPEQAGQVEALWERLIRTYLELSPESAWEQATNSSHFIPTQEPERVVRAVTEMLAALEQAR